LNAKLREMQAKQEKRVTARNVYKLAPTEHCGQNLWLLKPTGLNRGRGIHVFGTIEELNRLFKEEYNIKSLLSMPLPDDAGSPERPERIKAQTFVIQKYIERPLLFQGRKFDIRVWGLISFDTRCYLFK